MYYQDVSFVIFLFYKQASDVFLKEGNRTQTLNYHCTMVHKTNLGHLFFFHRSSIILQCAVYRFYFNFNVCLYVMEGFYVEKAL